MALIATRIDFLHAAAKIRGLSIAKLWQVITGCIDTSQAVGLDRCAVGLDRCWSNELNKDKPEFQGFKPMFHEERLQDILRTAKDCLIALGWHGELACQPPEALRTIFRILVAVIVGLHRHHVTYALSKHWGTILVALGDDMYLFDQLAPDFWAGTTVNLPSELPRIVELGKVPARRFVMFEPLIGNWDDLHIEADLIVLFATMKIEQVMIGGWSKLPEEDQHPEHGILKPYDHPNYRIPAATVKMITDIAHGCGAKVFHKHNLNQSIDPKDRFNHNLRPVKEIMI